MASERVRFFSGIGLAVLAAVLMVATDASLPASITLLIAGIVLIATSQRNRT
jgi:hypothetical protein